MTYYVLEKDGEILTWFGETMRFETKEIAQEFIEKNEQFDGYEIIKDSI